MRVISGKAKGRNLIAVPGDGTRPMLDRVKTALFDTLRPEIAEAEVLDLFAGTGQLGIESISQGAASCTFIEMDKKAVETVKTNLRTVGFESQCQVRYLDAFVHLVRTEETYDLIFIDPPQFKNLAVLALQHIAERPQLVRDQGKLIVKIHPDEYETVNMSQFIEEDKRTYGGSTIIFYRKIP